MKRPLKDRYQSIVKSYLNMFCAKQGVEIEFPGNDWYQIGDAMISLGMIRVDIDNEAPKGKIFEWYWKWIDQDECALFLLWLGMGSNK